MYIVSLALRNFRNYQAEQLELSPGLNILLGSNAQGKTNLLEAVYVLSLSKSYRATRESELIKHGEEQALLGAQVQKMARVDLRVILSKSETKRLTVNHKAVSAGSFLGILNTVLFTPDSLQLVKGSPGDRRRFLDIQICQIDPVYRAALLKYQRVVRQRNSLFKAVQDRRAQKTQLSAWDDQLVSLGTELILRREEVVMSLSLQCKKAQRLISAASEDLELVYQPFFLRTRAPETAGTLSRQLVLDCFWQELKKVRPAELRRGYTLVGPQRDELLFLINGQELKTFGSQGQQRTAVLAYILAELELMWATTGEYPVVLLDDVMSELDQGRREFLLAVLNEKAQTILTGTSLESFSTELVREAALFTVRQGRIV